MKARFETFNNISSLRKVNFFKAAEKWPFSNTNLLALPHFKWAVVGLARLITLYENLLFKHSKGVTLFTENLMKDLKIRFYGGKSSKSAVMEQIKDDLMAYLASNMTLEINGKKFFMNKVDAPNVEVNGVILRGMSAWTEQLWQKTLAIQKDMQTAIADGKLAKENSFIKGLEQVWFASSRERKIMFSSVASADPIKFQIYKNDFTQLLDPEYQAKFPRPQIFDEFIAQLVQYQIISQGIKFGRVSYAPLIPDYIYEQFHDNLTAIMKRVTNLDSERLSNPTLSGLYDNFKLQLAINLPTILPSIPANRIPPEDKNSRDETGPFNLRIPYSPNNADFMRYYGGVYIKVRENENFAYYNKIAQAKSNKHYQLKDKLFNKIFSLDKVLKQGFLLPAAGINGAGGKIYYNTLPKAHGFLEVGDRVFVREDTDNTFTEGVSYRITEKREGKKDPTVTIYTLEYLGPLEWQTNKTKEQIDRELLEKSSTPISDIILEAENIKAEKKQKERARRIKKAAEKNITQEEDNDIVSDAEIVDDTESTPTDELDFFLDEYKDQIDKC
jgi:hypothetical protein